VSAEHHQLAATADRIPQRCDEGRQRVPERRTRAVRQRRARETALRQNGYWLNGLVFLAQTGEDPAGLLDPRGDADLMTAGAIRAAARRYLDPAQHVRVTLLPEEGAVP